MLSMCLMLTKLDDSSAILFEKIIYIADFFLNEIFLTLIGTQCDTDSRKEIH